MGIYQHFQKFLKNTGLYKIESNASVKFDFQHANRPKCVK